MKKQTFSRVILSLTACLVVSLCCFVFNIIPKSVVATEGQTVEAGVGYTMSATTVDGVSIIADGSNFGAVNAPSFMDGTSATTADGVRKVYINGFSRMKATVVNFTEQVDVKTYDTFNFTFSCTASNLNVIFAFYPNESGVVVGETDNAGTYASGKASANTQIALSVDLRPFADENGKVTSFILVHANDTRKVNSEDADYNAIDFSFYNGTLDKAVITSSLAPETNYCVTDRSLTLNEEGITYPLPYKNSSEKYYVNGFKRLCATTVYLNKPVYKTEVYSITVNFSKNMGNETQFDFYPNLESVTVGNIADSKHTAISIATNGVKDTTTIRIADLADENGKVSSFVIVHTTDNRADDFAMTLNLFDFTLQTVADVTADNVLALDGKDMINGTSAASNSVGFITNTSAGKMYANNLLKGYAATVKFGTAIDTELWKTLELQLNILGLSNLSNKYTFYLDLYKSGATDFTHGAATARYTVTNSLNTAEENSFSSKIVINLEDFANEKGLVESVTIVHYDNSGNAAFGNLSVFESYLSSEKFISSEISDGEYTMSMPEKTSENKVFIGWEVNGELIAPFKKYNGETATATPVYMDFYMINGASIRINEPAGLRYSSIVSAESDAYLKEAVQSYRYGTWFTSPGSTAELIVLQSNSWISDGGNYTFNGVMVNIAEKDYERTFIGRSFVEITYGNGETMRILSAGSHVERTVAGVAQSTIDAGECADDQTKLDILKKFAGIE